MKRQKCISVYFDGGHGLVEFAEWLQERIAEIPERFHEEATIRIESEVIAITYERPETDEEQAAREVTARQYEE